MTPRALPPLNAVRAFEAASRHRNFSRAAEELGVTQGAISKQVIALEDFIGTKLFERLPGGLSLTTEGHALKQSITPAFEQLGEAFKHYSRRPPRSNVCRLATVASFAAEFLVPRLDAFKERLPDIELEILASDRLVDLAREEIDISVRFGHGDWEGVVARTLSDGTLVPVCAPAVLAQRQGDPDAWVANSRRIQIFSNNEWRNWAECTAFDMSNAKEPFITEDFVVATRAALGGHGLALLPEILVHGHLASGALVPFSDCRVSWKPTYYVAYAPGMDRQAKVGKVIAWLEAEAAAIRP